MNARNDSTKSVGLNIGHSKILLNEIILESVDVGNPHVKNVILTLPCHTNRPLPVLHEVIPAEMKEHCRSNHVKGFLSDDGQTICTWTDSSSRIVQILSHPSHLFNRIYVSALD
jgi:hypothetical protein